MPFQDVNPHILCSPNTCGSTQPSTHGFRASFRTWAQERTNVPREVCEAALAHTLKDKAEAAYARSDLFEKRRELMERWRAT